MISSTNTSIPRCTRRSRQPPVSSSNSRSSDGRPITPPAPLAGPGNGYFNSFRWTSGTFAGNVFNNSRSGAIQIDGVTLTVEPVKDILANIQLNPQPVGHGIEATFSPQGSLGAVNLADLAYAAGYSHFNWISQVTAIPQSVPLPQDKQGQTLYPPFDDPPPGGYLTASGGTVYDSLPYYIDVLLALVATIITWHRIPFQMARV